MKKVTVSIQIDLDLLAEIDSAASADDRSRSSFVVRALREKLNRG